MSVIIKDMEMPKTCSQCEIWSKCWDERPFWFERLEYCPLMEMADRTTEPTISKMEQVDKDINVRSKDEPQTENPCDGCVCDDGKHLMYCMNCKGIAWKTEPPKVEDEPQTDCYVSDLCKHYGDKQICGRCRSRNLFCEAEPQPRCPKCGKRGYIRSLESMGVKLKVFDEYKWKCTNCNKYFKEEPKDEPQTDCPKTCPSRDICTKDATDCAWK